MKSFNEMSESRHECPVGEDRSRPENDKSIMKARNTLFFSIDTPLPSLDELHDSPHYEDSAVLASFLCQQCFMVATHI